jgi:hypothetical protein
MNDGEIVVLLPAGARDFSLLCSAQTNVWAHSTSLSMFITEVFAKLLVREVDHSTPSRAEVEVQNAFIDTSHCPGMA